MADPINETEPLDSPFTDASVLFIGPGKNPGEKLYRDTISGEVFSVIGQNIYRFSDGSLIATGPGVVLEEGRPQRFEDGSLVPEGYVDAPREDIFVDDAVLDPNMVDDRRAEYPDAFANLRVPNWSAPRLYGTGGQDQPPILDPNGNVIAPYGSATPAPVQGTPISNPYNPNYPPQEQDVPELSKLLQGAKTGKGNPVSIRVLAGGKLLLVYGDDSYEIVDGSPAGASTTRASTSTGSRAAATPRVATGMAGVGGRVPGVPEPPDTGPSRNSIVQYLQALLGQNDRPYNGVAPAQAPSPAPAPVAPAAPAMQPSVGLGAPINWLTPANSGADNASQFAGSTFQGSDVLGNPVARFANGGMGIVAPEVFEGRQLAPGALPLDIPSLPGYTPPNPYLSPPPLTPLAGLNLLPANPEWDQRLPRLS